VFNWSRESEFAVEHLGRRPDAGWDLLQTHSNRHRQRREAHVVGFDEALHFDSFVG
jgi:hypothetical protein